MLTGLYLTDRSLICIFVILRPSLGAVVKHCSPEILIHFHEVCIKAVLKEYGPLRFHGEVGLLAKVLNN